MKNILEGLEIQWPLCGAKIRLDMCPWTLSLPQRSHVSSSYVLKNLEQEQITSADKYPSIFFTPNGGYCLYKSARPVRTSSCTANSKNVVLPFILFIFDELVLKSIFENRNKIVTFTAKEKLRVLTFTENSGTANARVWPFLGKVPFLCTK